MTNNANKVDRHVGGRVKTRRQQLGMSQEKLGSALGITFQQIQKYEKGTNRISASRLQQIGAALGVPAGYFFEGLQDAPSHVSGFAEPATPAYTVSTTPADEGLRLMRAFMRIGDPAVRGRIIELAESIAEPRDIPSNSDEG
ncbi:helix-turn-helix transcriptional regulator [Pseudochelatococcus contaminans]|uniref:Transcriptional regulator with XRE-family HTH domain n=1 Tax=Pseudochelatococcus contaminans TaxID=1538103 RepID=A0A7W5Z6Z2_9HYPH|nr:transcriptional regulator with XRE-family HTH domain [Pseudochelatococcus contaminans]